MCTPAKLFSISIITIENNFAGVHMSFRGSFRSHNPTRTILVGIYGVQYSARTEYSKYSTYSARTVRLHVDTSRTQNVLTT